MSDSRKYLLGATATIVAARITARAYERASHELRAPGDSPALKEEFIAIFRELEGAMDEIAKSSPAVPYAKKRSREDENILGD